MVGMVLKQFDIPSSSLEQYHQQKIPDTVMGFLGDLVVGGAICFLAQVIKLPFLPSSCVFRQPSQSLLRDNRPYLCSLTSMVYLSERQTCFVCLPLSICEQGTRKLEFFQFSVYVFFNCGTVGILLNVTGRSRFVLETWMKGEESKRTWALTNITVPMFSERSPFLCHVYTIHSPLSSWEPKHQQYEEIQNRQQQRSLLGFFF